MQAQLAQTRGQGGQKQSAGIQQPGNRGEKPGKVTAKALKQLIDDQGYRCALTGMRLTPELAAADHSIPLSRGGAHEMQNLQVVHRDVNAAKGTMTTEEFIEMCRHVTEWQERKTEKDGSFHRR